MAGTSGSVQGSSPTSASSKSGGTFSGSGKGMPNSANSKSGQNNLPLNSMKGMSPGIPNPMSSIGGGKSDIHKEKIPENLKRRYNSTPNAGNNKKSSEQSENSKNDNSSKNSFLNGLGNSNQKANDDEKGTVQNTAEKAVAKGGSAAMQAAGVPKPIADMIAKKASGPALKIAIISAIGGFLLWLIIIVSIISIMVMPILKGLALIKEVKEGISNFFNSSWNFVIGNGYCPNLEECSILAEEKFYDKVPKVKETYPNADMSLVLSSVLYGVGDGGRFSVGNYDECANKDPQKQQDCENDATIEGYQGAKDNLSKVARKLSKGKKEYDEYMIKTFIPKNYSEYLNGNTDAQKILDEIYVLSSMFNDYKNVISNNSTGGVCKYSVNGQDVSNVKVRLLNCNGSSNSSNPPIAGEELIDFEKYVLGVTYAENSGAPTEGLKAQAIAARSFALARAKSMDGNYGIKLEQENGQWILDIRNCTNDQVYCDPDKGCWSDSSSAGDNVYSGYVEGKAWSKPALSTDSEIRKAVSDVNGKVLIDSAGNVILAPYTNVQQTKWNDKAKNGQDYTSILLEEYSNAKTIMANCSADLSGDWATWKQCDPRWGNTKMGNSASTLCDVGCLVSSISIQIARSGTPIYLPAGVSEFNPGIFVQYNSSMLGTTNCPACYNTQTPWTQSMAPGFVSAGFVDNICGTRDEKVNKVAEYINQGYYLVLKAKYPDYGEHWVAAIGTQGNEIIIVDPGRDVTNYFDYYGSLGANQNCLRAYMFKTTD